MALNFNPLAMALKPLLMQAIAQDELFAIQVAQKKNKSLNECAEWLMGEAYLYAKEHKNGNFGLSACSDEEMIGHIKHYWDEDNIKITKVGADAKAKVTTTADKKADKKADTSTKDKKAEQTTTKSKKATQSQSNKAKRDDDEIFCDSLF